MTDPAGAHQLGTRPGRPQVPWWLQLVLSAGLTAICLVVLVPQLPDGERSVQTMHRLSLRLLGLALLLEALSLTAYSAMSSLVFAGSKIRFPVYLRVDLTTTGLSHAMPAGGATAAAFRLRLLRQAGVNGSDVVAGATVQATAADLVLGCLFLAGVLVSVGAGGNVAAYLFAAGLVALSVLAAAAFGMLLVHRGSGVAAWLRNRHRKLPLLGNRRVAGVLQSLTTRLTDMTHHPSRTSQVLGCAGLNWVLDAAVLWVMLAAVGQHLGLGPLLVAYGLANLLAIVPLTPGGLGVIEGVLIPALVGFGVPASSALVAVLGWRLCQFWLPIPVAGACYLSLRVGPFALRPATAVGLAADRPPR